MAVITANSAQKPLDKPANLLLKQFLAALAEPFTGEELYDSLTDAVFFIKNLRCEYVMVNRTLVERCGKRNKSDLIGKRADQVFPAPLGESYRHQDEMVISRGEPILNQLELHFYPAASRGWCLTNKLPLRGRHGEIAGLYGVSKDIQSSAEQTEDYAQLAEALRLIHTGYEQPLRVEDLARLAGFSAYQFEQRIKKIFQLTPAQLIQKVRIDAALRQLRDTEKSIAEIALSCGYSDQSAFTRQFRNKTGLSPAQFRRTIRLEVRRGH